MADHKPEFGYTKMHKEGFMDILWAYLVRVVQPSVAS